MAQGRTAVPTAAAPDAQTDGEISTKPPFPGTCLFCPQALNASPSSSARRRHSAISAGGKFSRVSSETAPKSSSAPDLRTNETAHDQRHHVDVNHEQLDETLRARRPDRQHRHSRRPTTTAGRNRRPNGIPPTRAKTAGVTWQYHMGALSRTRKTRQTTQRPGHDV